MMPKSNKLKSSKLNYVSSKISQLQQELRELQRKNKARKKTFKYAPHDLIQIPKPKGAAGRNPPKGYNLQTEMGLGDNKRRYNNYQAAVRKLVDGYLDVSKTMKDQKKLDVCKIITIAQKKHKYLRRFIDGWPVRDMVGMYLRNSVACEKRNKSRKSDSEDSDEGDATDPNQSSHGEDDLDKNAPSESDDTMDEEVNNSDDQDMAGKHVKRDCNRDKKQKRSKSIAPSDVVKKAAAKKTNDTAIPINLKRKKAAINDEDEDGYMIDQPKKKRIMRMRESSRGDKNDKDDKDTVINNKNVTPNHAAIKAAAKTTTDHAAIPITSKGNEVAINDGDEDGYVIDQPKKKRIMRLRDLCRGDEDDEDTTPMIVNVADTPAKTKPTPPLTICPYDDCYDPIPDHPKPALFKMFQYHRKLIDEQGPNTAAVLSLSRLNGWPTVLDFKRMPDRIMAMKDELEALIMVQGTRGDGPVQQGLRDSLVREGLGGDFNKLATVNPNIVPEIIINNARPG